MGTKWHHFRNYVERGEIKILPIDTLDQPADVFSKALPRDSFEKHRDFIMGWPRSPNERECEETTANAMVTLGSKATVQCPCKICPPAKPIEHEHASP